MDARVQKLDERVETLDERVEKIESEQKDQGRNIGKLQQDVAELKGRFTGVEAMLLQIPTLWQIATLIFAIFGASFLLIRFASGH